MKYKAVFWDFDGVWSKDYFYKSLAKSNPKVWDYIQTNIFGPKNNGITGKWMHGELDMNDINKLISKNTGMDFDSLNTLFLTDVSKMIIEMRHIPIIKSLKKLGITVGMITDNMDVFDSVTVPRLNLDKLFDGNVFNSYAFKKRKADGLFDIAIKSVGCGYSGSLLIDDSEKARNTFEANGGQVYAYRTFDEFAPWAKDNLWV